ncbi:MAG TPA: hypothetical protein VLW85_20455, partial [Myxococcales bacterium]|nr:hypothetical protein [Myxococcales bacterium]
IQKRQAKLAHKAASLADEKDPQKILDVAKELQEECADLEKAARNLEKSIMPPDFQGKGTVVKLTADQRQRITEQTGIGLEEVTVHDSRKKVWSQELPRGTVEPREIEAEAAREAARLKRIAMTKEGVEKAIKQLKAFNVPELDDFIQQLEKDPTLGLGGKK